ncbi:hypothetical protein Hte_002275 [Hypoxylon texense]
MGKDVEQEKVPVLDMKHLRLVLIERGDLEGYTPNLIDLPRFKFNVKVSASKDGGISNGGSTASEATTNSKDMDKDKSEESEALATVDLSQLGIRYNLQRFAGNSRQLYVLTED